jgi:hypothetical protein
MQHIGSKEQSVIEIKDIPPRKSGYCPSELVIFFRLMGSKSSQYLRIESSEHVGFPHAGWWRKRERESEGEFVP